MRFSELLFLVCICVTATSCSLFTYASKEVELTIIDKETGESMRGVLVLALWRLDSGFFHRAGIGTYKYMEQISDSEGKVYFPGWGPVITVRGFIDNNDNPVLYVFRHGYKFRAIFNKPSYSTSERGGYSQWHKKTISLMKVEENEINTIENVKDLSWAIYDVRGNYEKCHWKSVPKALGVLLEERRFFSAKEYTWPDTVLDNLLNNPYITKNRLPDDCPLPRTMILGENAGHSESDIERTEWGSQNVDSVQE